MTTRTLPASNRTDAIASLSRMLEHFLPGRELEITVEELKPERSDRQRAALFGCAYKALMDQMGLSGAREKDELHTTLCGAYWGWRAVEVLGTQRRVPVRTTTTNEQGKRDVITMRAQLEFYEFIQRTAAEFGFDVPDPDPAWRIRAEMDAELEQRR